MEALIDVKRLVRLHDSSVERWHAGPLVHDQRDELWKQILLNHAHNFELWHEEDKARDPGAGDGVIAAVKRRIDGINQQRNDAMERIDEQILKLLAAGPAVTRDDLPQHSETVGNIVDRLSILSLKIFHMREQTHRTDVDEAHRLRSQERLSILVEQRDDLALALKRLDQELQGGEKRFRIYRQMKMYNDPSLNPVLYGKPK